MSQKCPTCTKTVYFAERVQALGKDYHKLCFKCLNCKKLLEVGKFSERDNNLYCKTCYGQLFAPKGYGFGNTVESFVEKPTGTAGGAAAGGGSKFCTSCGVGIEGVKFCGNCGAKAL
eukprot:TRINITY_DN22395_c0_g1_i1.p1 TRINITY_DN22395_c0_g1~~TRINITY_DN22395_c0_g1_i1.p1  ORF type:complete len:117 (+),score=46.76 TRINITY_DN22395_c0_g1_i1:53-403(+)